MKIAGRMTILKDGVSVTTVDRGAGTIPDLISLMVGRPLQALFDEDVPREIGAEILRVEGLSRSNVVRDVSLSLKAREILGLGGLVGAGRTELVRLIFGADRAEAGTIWIKGKQTKIRSPIDAVTNGIGMAPENRKDHGLILEKSIAINPQWPA